MGLEVPDSARFEWVMTIPNFSLSIVVEASPFDSFERANA